MIDLGEQGCLVVVPLVRYLGDIQHIGGPIDKRLVIDKSHSIASCCRIRSCGNRTADVSDAMLYRNGLGETLPQPACSDGRDISETDSSHRRNDREKCPLPRSICWRSWRIEFLAKQSMVRVVGPGLQLICSTYSLEINESSRDTIRSVRYDLLDLQEEGLDVKNGFDTKPPLFFGVARARQSATC